MTGKSQVLQKVLSCYQSLSALASCGTFTLAPFSKGEVEVMLEDALGIADTAELVEVIYENSDGMPAYLSEVM